MAKIDSCIHTITTKGIQMVAVLQNPFWCEFAAWLY